jgi:PAS domain-containing protein
VAQLEAVMEAVPYALAVYDTSGRVILANTTYSTHAPPNEALAERIRHIGGVFDTQGQLLTEAQWPQTRALQGEVLSGAHAMELALQPPSGEPAYSRVTAAPLRDPDGNIIGAVTLNQEITEQKRLEREREAVQAEAERQASQLTAVFEAMADGVVVFDKDGHLTRENAAHRLMLGLDEAVPPGADMHLSERTALFPTYDEQGRLIGPGEGPLARALQRCPRQRRRSRSPQSRPSSWPMRS